MYLNSVVDLCVFLLDIYLKNFGSICVCKFLWIYIFLCKFFIVFEMVKEYCLIVDKGILNQVFKLLICDDVIGYWVVILIFGMFCVFFDMNLCYGFFFYILIDEVVQVLEMEILIFFILVGNKIKVVFMGDYMQVYIYLLFCMKY